MKNASIKVKLTLATLPSLFILIACIVIFTIAVNKSLTESKKTYYDTLYTVNDNLINADRDFYQAMLNASELHGYQANNSPILTEQFRKEYIEDYNENVDQVEERVGAVVTIAKANESLLYSKDEKGNTFEENLEAFEKGVNEWKGMYDINSRNNTDQQFSDFEDKFDETREYISNMSDIAETWSESQTNVVQSNVMRALIIAIIVFVVLAILMSIWDIYLMKLIGNSIRVVSARLDKLSNYDLSEDPIKVDSNDELGRMKQALNNTEEALENIVGILRSTSNGLTDASNTVSQGTNATGVGIDNVSSAADELANASTSMAQDVSDISMNMTELSDVMERSVNSAKELSNASTKIGAVTDQGNAVVEQLAGINEKSYVEFNAIFDAIEDIKASGAKISEASELILNIADQTNLLSLNASIEAARAGEAGKGFAVVADEIRKLSDESKENVDTINEILSELTAATNNAAKKADVVKDYVQKQNDAVGETKNSFDAIVESVESVEAAIAELERVNEELNAKSKEIDESVSNLSALSEENAATSEQLSATALTVQGSVQELKVTQGDVANSSGDLSNIVGRFILADEPVAPEDVETPEYD